MVTFELAVQDLQSAAAAARLGVDRMELCSALATGGVTPSQGFIEAAVSTGVPVHVLVRPRTGDFAYSPEEKSLIVRDSARALEAGAAGVVVGGMHEGRIDEALVRSVVGAAGTADVTFHRAFDTAVDRSLALDALAALGVRRVLTSGGAHSAPDGREELKRLVRHAQGSIEIMAGGGVTADNVPQVLRTGVAAVHASAKCRVPEGSGLSLGSLGESLRETVDEEHARRIMALLQRESHA